MTTLRSEFRKNPIFKFFSSITITVVCLVLLLILTFWGTVDQVYNGLYHAQQQFFNSWGFLGFGFLPFPGAHLVLWVLFINLVCVSITRFVYKLSHLGILIIHFGLLTYFVAAFVTFAAVREAHITLNEGEGTNISSSYYQWELSAWHEAGEKRKVTGYDLRYIKPGTQLNFDELGFNVKVAEYYPNSAAYAQAEPSAPKVINDSGIKSLKMLPASKEPEKNSPGGIFSIPATGKETMNVLLYGGESSPTKVSINGQDVYLQMRSRKIAVPFSLKLVDFRMEKHPNTEIARSYESLVEITDPHMTREVLISMNNPLRYRDFAVYQSSYSIDAMGRESSTLAVVENAGRLLPYIATFLVVFGLVVHFLFMGFFQRTRKAE